MDDDSNHLSNLQGRIIALELIIRSYLTELALDHDEPVRRIQEIRDAATSTLQNLTLSQFPNHEVDAIWEEAMTALRTNFEEAVAQVASWP